MSMAELQQPNVVGNFLSSYYTAQQKQQADADRQRNMQRQDVADERASQQFDMQMDLGKIQTAKAKTDALNEILSGVDTANPASLDMAKQRFVQTFGGDPQAVAGITMADIPRIKMQTGQTAAELDLQYKRAQIAATNRSNRGGGAGGSGAINSAMQRAQLAQAYGIDPQSAAGQKFVLTGQLPASLSPTDKKAILEADQMVMASEQGLGMLNQAKTLNPKAAGGFGMGTLADIFAQIGDETALNTRDLENVLQSNVLPQLKVIFGGAPTEGERQILLDLQGSAKKTVEERRRIIDRSIAAANARIGFYRDQANDLRGGTYYSPTRGQPQPPAATATAAPKKKTTLPNGVTIEELD
jgi:hypothetical protein